MASHQNHSAAPTSCHLELVPAHNHLGDHNNATSAPSVHQETADPGCNSRPRRHRHRLHVRLIRKLNMPSLLRKSKQWLEHPAHVALLVWALCVAASGSMLGLLLLGLLDEAFPTKSLRNRWIEINNQILNALFTLMSIYQHPNLIHHSVLLCRWLPEDVKDLRKAYCKNATSRPRERFHMSVVVALLHLTCFSQYVMCGLYWGFSRKTRPEAAETSLAVVGTLAPVLAGLYTNYSPLGRKCEVMPHQETDVIQVPDDVTVEVTVHTAEVAAPEWAGGLFDVGDDSTVCCLSFFCTFCLFGWNMERLGFGNMYVHLVMFVLLCFAPLWIFNIAAMNIRDKAVGDMVGAMGVLLCALGLLYGGYWRVQMRKRYRLPGNDACCGSASFSDYLLWVFCWGCSLAQEVRTGNLLDVEEGSVYRRDVSTGEEEGRRHATLQPLPRENGLKSHDASVPVISHSAQLANYLPSQGDESPLLRQEETCVSPAEEMTPPVPASLRGERRVQ